MDIFPNGIAILKNKSAIYHNHRITDLLNISSNLNEEDQSIIVLDIHIIILSYTKR